MIDLNERIRKHFKPLSLERMNAKFCYPNWYHVTSVADFINNKENIVPTPNKLFLMDRSYSGAAPVILHNCDYELRHEPHSKGKFDQLWEMDLRFLRLEQTLGISLYEHQELLDKMVAQYHNARISDSTGEIGIHSAYNIPNGTKFHRAWMVYHPMMGIINLDDYKHCGTTIEKQGQKARLDKMAQLITKLSPA